MLVEGHQAVLRLDAGEDAQPLGVHRLGRIAAGTALAGRNLLQRHLQARAQTAQVVPGNLGQAWIGASPDQFLTITSASIVLKNNLETRTSEFGSRYPRAICPGQRAVTASFDLYSQDDDATKGLYQAARQESPISVMFQLGETPGQVVGVYLKSVIPVVPEFDDGKNRLQWKFRSSRAQGTIDDEIAVAFG